MVSLQGRVALVTGGSGGIGTALAVALAQAGADIALTYDRQRDKAESTVAQVQAYGRRAFAMQADLNDPSCIEKIVAQTHEQLSSLDILVANAGAGRKFNWDDQALDVQEWDRTLAINVRGPWLLTREVLPRMIERGYGRILFVSSIAAFNGGFIGPHYAASKAALHGLMHHIAPRVAAKGITVNSIAPALIDETGMMAAASDEKTASVLPIPVGRLGMPGDVAELALSMITNSYITNKVFMVDGGLYPA